MNKPPVQAMELMKEMDDFANEMEKKYPHLRGMYMVAQLWDTENKRLQPMIGGGAVNGAKECGAFLLMEVSDLLHLQSNAEDTISKFEEELRDASTSSSREALH